VAAAFESSVTYEESRIHAAALYCSDGRIGEQVDDFLQQGLALPRYDRVAVPGGPACLAGRLLGFWESRGVEDQIRFLMEVHEIERFILIAHQDCAFYRQRLRIDGPQVRREQVADLERAARVVLRLGPALQVEGFYATLHGQRMRFDPLGILGRE
jgi:carbonic anhydrase-like protein